MNTDEMKGKWEQLKGKLREKWSKFTEDDWQQVKGDKEKMVGKIQEKYGIAQEEAEKEVHDFFDKDKDHRNH